MENVLLILGSQFSKIESPPTTTHTIIGGEGQEKNVIVTGY